MARYDSWNPAPMTFEGAIVSWMTRAMKNMFMGLVSRPAILAASLRVMNSNALTREADAPVMRVYHAEIRMTRHDLTFLIARKLPKTDVTLRRIQYNMEHKKWI